MAYHELKTNGELPPARHAVVLVLQHYPQGLTRAQISHYTSKTPGIRYYPINSVCGRVNELLESHILVEDGIRKCPITGKSAKIVKLAS